MIIILTDPLYRQRGHPTSTKAWQQQMSGLGSQMGLDTRLTGLLTVYCNVPLTFFDLKHWLDHNDLCLSRLKICSRHTPLKVSAPAKQISQHHWKFSKTRHTYGFQPSVCIRLYNKIVQTTSRSRTKPWEWNVRSVGQGEARHRNYKRLKLGDCQAYDRLRD
jgi:hypothetical protein